MLVLVLLAQMTTGTGQAQQGCTPTPLPQCQVNLIVRVVDTAGGSLPGTTVRAKAKGTSEEERLGTTNGDGLAMLCVAGGVQYDLRAKLSGFRQGHSRSDVVARPHSPSGPTRASIQLRPAGPTITVE